MTDRILIRDLLLRAIVGVNDEERRDRQDVLINVVLYADTRPAGASDSIDDAVNYRTLTKQIIALVEGSRFYLVEKLAAEIAALCLAEPRVERAIVRVEKPGALRFARSVGVEIDRAWADPQGRNRAYVSLGSNVDPERNLREAVRRLREHGRLLAVSPVYETEPVGTRDQPSFLNAAALVETACSAGEFRHVLRSIEHDLGRVRTADENAPRTIDLDLSLFNGEILEVDGHPIPDPAILLHAHVARPLADLDPGYTFPGRPETLAHIAARLGAEGLVPRPDLVL